MRDSAGAFAAALTCVLAATGRAQSTAADTASPRDAQDARHAVSKRPEFGRNTRVMLASAAGAALAVSLFDSRLVAGTERWEDRRGLGRTSAIGNFVGGPVPITVGVALYATGRAVHHPFTANLGREVIRAVLVSGGLTAVAKGIVGRARPFASPGDADEFDPGGGFTNSALTSFPSGHTSAAFATATVVARELNAKHPRGRRFINPLLFGGATLVGFGRIYGRQHWPSDVVVGAAVGAITGYEVVAHARGDRSRIRVGLLSHLSLQPNREGIALGWALR